MNEGNDEMINTEEPIKVSEKERALILEALERVEQGEFILHEEMKAYTQQLIDEYDSLPSYQENIVRKDKEQQAGTVRDL